VYAWCCVSGGKQPAGILGNTAHPVYILPMAHTATAAKAGVGFGTALAITISWSVNKSILWAIVHGIFSWFYVIYFALLK
jgi:hypothetical protein